MSDKPDVLDQLKSENELLLRYLEIAEVILVVIDPDETVTYINRLGCRVLARQESEIVGRNWFETAIPERLRGEVRDRFRDVLSGQDEALERFENPIVDGSGEERLVSWTNRVLRDTDGRVTATLSSGKDITEQRASERLSAESEERIRAIVDTAIDGIITIDTTGCVLSFNPAAERMFGYGETEVLGRNVSMLMPEPERSRHDDYIESYLGTGVKKIIGIGREVMGRRKDGTTFPIFLGIGSAHLDRGEIFVGTVRDLSQFKKMQGELFESQHLAVLGEMAASIAHEIKNPLAAICGVVSVLKDHEELASHHEVLGDLLDRVEGLDRTVRSLLQFARPRVLDKQRFDLGELVGNVISSLRLDPLFERIEIVQDGDRGFELELDVLLFEEVLRNVFYNAAEAMPEGGCVRVGLEADEEWVSATISDHGPGIPEESKEKIFRPFVTTKPQGTGLGLALSRRIIDAHGGHILIRNGATEGTEVRIEMPR